MKKTKTWKIGEYCQGGIITAEVKKENDDSHTITIIGKEWDFSAGSRRSSNQKNAKEFTRLEVKRPRSFSVLHEFDQRPETRQLYQFLGELTTAYYAGQVMEWVSSVVSPKKTA